MTILWPNHALQQTPRERRGCNSRVSCAGSLSLGDLLEQVRELGEESDISVHVGEHALIVKAPPEQQRRVAELVEAMRRKARPNPAVKRNP